MRRYTYGYVAEKEQPIGQVFFRADLFLDIFWTFWISKAVYGKTVKNQLCCRFWDQRQPIGQAFFRADCFLTYFRFFGFQKMFFMEQL